MKQALPLVILVVFMMIVSPVKAHYTDRSLPGDTPIDEPVPRGSVPRMVLRPEVVVAIEEAQRIREQGYEKLKKGDAAGALHLFEESRELWCSHEATEGIIEALTSLGRLPEATAEFKSLLEPRSGYGKQHRPDVWVRYARLLVVIGRNADAVNAYRTAVERLDCVVAPSIASLPVNERSFDAKLFQAATCLVLGTEMTRWGRYKEAEAQFQEAMRLRPNLAAGYLCFGWSLHRTGNKTEAIRMLNKAAALGDSGARALADKELRVTLKP